VPHPNVVLFDVRVGFHSRLKLGISRFAPPHILAAAITELFSVPASAAEGDYGEHKSFQQTV